MSAVLRRTRPLISFLARRFLLAAFVLAAVSFASFALIATRFSATCTSQFTPTSEFAPPLASTVHQATILYWGWVKGIPSGRSFGSVCNGSVAGQLGPAAAHTGLLLAATAVLVLCFSLLLGTLAATRAGTVLDGGLRGFSYAAWAVPPFVLALMLQSIFRWAGSRYGIHWFGIQGWPERGSGLQRVFDVVRTLVLPAVALSVAFVGLHSRYLRSALLVALHAPYTTTARSKGLPERTVVLRHALRNSLATFLSAILLDFGAIFGAALAIDWVFSLNGLGMLLINEIAGIGAGDGPRFLNPYAVETLLSAAALLVIASSLVAELAVAGLDPRARLR